MLSRTYITSLGKSTTLKMWFNGTHYVVATSAQEAFDLVQDFEDSTDDFNEDDWECLTSVTFCKGYFCSPEY